MAIVATDERGSQNGPTSVRRYAQLEIEPGQSQPDVESSNSLGKVAGRGGISIHVDLPSVSFAKRQTGRTANQAAAVVTWTWAGAAAFW